MPGASFSRPAASAWALLGALCIVLGSASSAMAVGTAGPPRAPRPRPATTAQSLFAGLLIHDSNTNREVVGALRSGRAFVDPSVTYADVTRDGRNDALVRVDTAGATGAIAVYVFSTDGQRPDRRGNTRLRAVYRGEGLYRASVVIRSAAVVVRAPRYAPGDDLCCPATVLERTLAWHASEHMLRVRSTVAVRGPRG